MGAKRGVGYFEEVGPEGTRAGETFTCCHCNTVHEVVKGTPFGMCHSCWAPVCDACNAKGTCTPFEKRLARWESRDRMLRAIGV